MGTIFVNVTGWLIRKCGLLLLLVAALMLAPSAKEVWRVVGQFDPDFAAREIKRQLEERVPGKDLAKDKSELLVKTLRAQLDQRKVERSTLDSVSCYLPTCTVVNGARRYRVDIEIELIEQAVMYVEAARNGAKTCDDYAVGSKDLEDLRRQEEALTLAKPFWTLPSQEHRNLKIKIEDRTRVQVAREKMCQNYHRLAKTFVANQIVAQKKIERAYEEVFAKLEELKQSQSAFMQSATEVLPAALKALFGIIFVPIGIKLFSYYGVAPLASRRFGVRLLPETSGELTVASSPHDIQRIELEKGWELLIDPALLRSSPDSVEKDAKYVLDWSMPFSSVASGLYLLTRIRGNGTVTISDDRDNMNKITVLELPENAALVLQPRCLGGIVQRISQPIRITRHWRLGNLGSWLTLQLRYVIFHGPAKLIVSGSRGVEVDASQAGCSINQAATLGFSANLGYGVARCAPFYGYLSGKKELFNDCFSSGPGYYVHEVRPRPAKKTLLPGRGIEGIINSVLKIYGL